ncbi:MAG: HAD family hydrolase [Coriobacteriia bacterium]
MMRAILFDLDGTLLDLDLDGFLARYFTALRGSAAMVPGLGDGADAIAAISRSTQAMFADHPGLTNREVFFSDFLLRTGVDLGVHWGVFEDFYRETFPGLRGDAGPAPGARRVVETALGLGLRVAVATNPIFPRIAVEHRLAWAGLADLPFDAITTYEVMRACKPRPEYFLQTASMLGTSPEECLMVGDDASLDLPASATGMSTWYVGGDLVEADMHGDLDGLSDALPFLGA